MWKCIRHHVYYNPIPYCFQIINSLIKFKGYYINWKIIILQYKYNAKHENKILKFSFKITEIINAYIMKM